MGVTPCPLEEDDAESRLQAPMNLSVAAEGIVPGNRGAAVSHRALLCSEHSPALQLAGKFLLLCCTSGARAASPAGHMPAK